MKPPIEATQFGSITLGGVVYDHDVLVRPDATVRRRKKKLSKAVYGTSHTISLAEAKYVYCCAPFKMGTPALLSMGTGGWGAKEEVSPAARSLRTFDVVGRGDSCAVGGRQAPTGAHENPRTVVAALDPPPPCAAGWRLGRAGGTTTRNGPATAGAAGDRKAAAGQPHRAFPRPNVVATEPQHPRTHGEHDRLDRVAQIAARRADRGRFRVQRDDPPPRARAQAPSASAGSTQPATHGALRPRELPGDRGRCPAPAAARRSASPITSAPSRRRGTVHEGDSTCVVSHAPQRARRGMSGRTSPASRTSRERANPQGDNRPEQPGHASSPAANAASTRSAVIAI